MYMSSRYGPARPPSPAVPVPPVPPANLYTKSGYG